jgi:hypothetical protein
MPYPKRIFNQGQRGDCIADPILTVPDMEGIRRFISTQQCKKKSLDNVLVIRNRQAEIIVLAGELNADWVLMAEKRAGVK